MKTLNVLEMLSYCRPAWSAIEEEFISKYIDRIPGMYRDKCGNRIRLGGAHNRVMIACHTDTVHERAGRQEVVVSKSVAMLPFKSVSNCLGADDTAGVYAALRMIASGSDATFVFHRGEEMGGQGSGWLADNYPAWLATFYICLSLDRRGTKDIVTSQYRRRTASDVFAVSLSEQLGMQHRPVAGIFTDSANYAHLISECSNLSVGYQNEHSWFETLDLDYLEKIIDRLVHLDWQALEVARFDQEELGMEELGMEELGMEELGMEERTVEFVAFDDDSGVDGWAL